MSTLELIYAMWEGYINVQSRWGKFWQLQPYNIGGPHHITWFYMTLHEHDFEDDFQLEDALNP